MLTTLPAARDLDTDSHHVRKRSKEIRLPASNFPLLLAPRFCNLLSSLGTDQTTKATSYRPSKRRATQQHGTVVCDCKELELELVLDQWGAPRYTRMMFTKDGSLENDRCWALLGANSEMLLTEFSLSAGFMPSRSLQAPENPSRLLILISLSPFLDMSLHSPDVCCISLYIP